MLSISAPAAVESINKFKDIHLHVDWSWHADTINAITTRTHTSTVTVVVTTLITTATITTTTTSYYYCCYNYCY